jgi:hypothetical protein
MKGLPLSERQLLDAMLSGNEAALTTVLSTTQLRRYETQSQFIGIGLASSESSR